MTARVVLAEAQQRTREALRDVLTRAPDVTVVGEACDGASTLEQLDETNPDVAVIDLGLAASGGSVETVREVLRRHPAVGVVALSNHADERYAVALREAGVTELVVKSRAGEQLADAVARAERDRPAQPVALAADPVLDVPEEVVPEPPAPQSPLPAELAPDDPAPDQLTPDTDVELDSADEPATKATGAPGRPDADEHGRQAATSTAPHADSVPAEAPTHARHPMDSYPESLESRLNEALQPEIPKSSPAALGNQWQTEGCQPMELLEALRTDVEGLYERVTGESFPREQFQQVPAPLPPQVEPVTYLRQELEQLKLLVDQRLNPEADPAQNRWLPVADVVAEADRYTVRVELPGMTKQDIKLAIGDNVIRIEGERSLNLPPNTQVVTCERVYGPFERWITFPFQINKSDLSIRFENGILEISVTRVENPLGNLESVNFS